MKVLSLLWVAVLVTAGMVFSEPVSAESGVRFKLGFQALADQVPEVVGTPLEEHWGESGVSLQQTTDLSPTQPIPAGPVSPFPNVEYHYYEVQGATSQELRDQVAQLGPVDDQGHRWPAITSWSLQWGAVAVGEEMLKDVEVTYRIRVMLPRWAPPLQAPASVVEEWARYTDRLIEHENRHVEIVIVGIPRVATALTEAGRSQANQAFETEMNRLRQQQEELDLSTDHGLLNSPASPD